MAARCAIVMIVPAISGTSCSGGVPTRAAISSSLPNSEAAAIAPTAAVLRMFLPASKAKCCGLNRFLRPETGLSFLKSGLMASGVGFSPTWPVAASRPATKHVPTIGRIARPTCRPTIRNSVPVPCLSTTSGWAINWMTCTIASFICSMAFGPAAESAIRPARRIAAPLTSADLATWPFLRASSRFLGVAFSVLSLAIALRRPDEVQGLADGLLQRAVEVVGDERQRGAEQDQADDQLGGEA